MLFFQGLLYLSKIIRTQIINKHHNDLLTDVFKIEKTQELITQKYYWLTLQANIEAYVKRCNVCVTFKAIRNKLYGDLQSLPVLTHCWKDLSMDFVTDLSVSTNWKSKTYNSILVIVDWLTKMIYCKWVKVTINASGLAEVIIDIVMPHHNLPASIVSNRGLVYTLKFWLLLCYFLGIK